MQPVSAPLAAYFGVLPATPEDETFRRLIQLGMLIVGADEGSLLVFDAKKDVLVFAMTAGNDESERVLLGQEIPLGQGVTGKAAALGEVQIGTPKYHDINFAERIQSKSSEPEVVIAAPMFSGNSLVGAITAVSWDIKKRFTTRDADLYAQFGYIGGLLVEQVQRIKSYELSAGAEGGAHTAVLTEDEKLSNELLDTIGEINGTDTRNLREIVSLLKNINAMVKKG